MKTAHAWLSLALATALPLAGCTEAMERMEAHQIPEAAPTASPHVDAAWMGTAGVLLDDGKTAILIDPFVSRPSVGRVLTTKLEVDEARIDLWMKMPGIERTAAVLVSHSHYDHLMDAPSFARRTDAVLVGSQSTINIGHTSGLPDEQLRIADDQWMKFGDFEIKLLPSKHGPALLGKVPYPGDIPASQELPAKARRYRMGGAFSIVVRHPAGTLVHHASAAWVPGMFEHVDADVVLLGIAGRDDTAEYLRAVMDGTGARRVVPIHWDNFFRSFDKSLAPLGQAKLEEFLDTVRDTRPDLTLETLPLGHARPVLTADG